MTLSDLLREATKQFETAGIPSARLDAEVLLAYCLNCDRVEFLKNPLQSLSEARVAAFQSLVERRRRLEPVAYLTGRKAFWSFTLEVNPAVLIPRPDTEVLVEEALEVCRLEAWRAPRILDIGTGSGAIALALASELPAARVAAVDISEAALVLARKNAKALGLDRRIRFLAGNLLQPVQDETFDIIVSNPPYIGAEEYEKLPAGVKDFEPRQALWAGKTGVEFYEKLIYQADAHLAQKGWLLLEIGAKQGQQVKAIMEKTGLYDRLHLRADYAGWPRVLKGRRKKSG